jgi:hypothetical protein
MGDKTPTFEERVELFRQSVASDENRKEYATTWAALIDEVLPVEATVRSIFTTELLAPGAVPMYSTDVQPIEAWYLPKYGQAPTHVVEVEEVAPTTFEITSKVEYKIRDAQQGRLPIGEKSMMRLKDAIVLKEDTAGWDVIKAAVTNAMTVTSASTGLSGEVGLTKAVCNAAFELMEGNRGYKVTDIYVGPGAAADLRAWTVTDIDPVTQREIWQNAGHMPSLWGATIHTVHFLDDDEVYFLDTTPGKLGYMPIRTNLKTWDNPTSIDRFRVGIVGYEEVGFCLLDANTVVKATLR